MLFLVVALLVFISQSIFTHWWLIIPNAWVAGVLLGRSAWRAFFGGFFGVGMVWLGKALFHDWQNKGLLSDKIATLFQLPQGEWLIVLTLLLGALTGGIAAWAGYSLQSLFKNSH